MDGVKIFDIKAQLTERRQKLEEAVTSGRKDNELVNLLKDVDQALDRLANGTYGICEVCHDPIEENLLAADPLITFCIDHLSPSQQKALEEDLKLAREMQLSLLPQKELELGRWQTNYHYAPAGAVSGDYIGIQKLEERNGEFLFLLGDVTGKGVAASMLMSQMHATFRTLGNLGMQPAELLKRANRLFCESTLYSHFMTLVLGVAHDNGTIEICNAGHCLPVVINGENLTTVNSNSLPIGLFCNLEFSFSQIKMNPGDTLLLYTDGLSEAEKEGDEYGADRISELLLRSRSMKPKDIISNYLADIRAFTGTNESRDDTTILLIRRN